MGDQIQRLSLRGIRAIIVENNFTVAQSLKWMLESYGCEITGMVATPDAALELIARVPFDVALLDVQLAGGSAAPVAARINERGGKAIYVTGYADLDMLPPELRSFPRLVKPVDPELLLSTILDAVGPRGE
jgi:DNA-binding NtrC family response regulator